MLTIFNWLTIKHYHFKTIDHLTLLTARFNLPKPIGYWSRLFSTTFLIWTMFDIQNQRNRDQKSEITDHRFWVKLTDVHYIYWVIKALFLSKSRKNGRARHPPHKLFWLYLDRSNNINVLKIAFLICFEILLKGSHLNKCASHYLINIQRLNLLPFGHITMPIGYWLELECSYDFLLLEMIRTNSMMIFERFPRAKFIF